MSPVTESHGPKPVEKKIANKKVTAKVQKSVKLPNPNARRSQPAAAARLIASPYIRFNWHQPLSGETKDVIQRVSSIADSMYMLQMDRTRPIEALSLRNGLFWERRQLLDPEILCTPGIDHLELFPTDNDTFRETLIRMAKRPTENKQLSLHYLFGAIRSREFLLMPVQIKDVWITIIGRIQRKENVELDRSIDSHADMELTNIAFVDPLLEGREERHTLVLSRLEQILAQGCIESSLDIKIRNFAVPDIRDDGSKWQTGLVAYAISREFIRRLKVLQHRQAREEETCQDFLWAPFEEDYNFDAYRQNLLSACGHHCVEGSGYRSRIALEVPSEDSMYDRSLLGADDNILAADDKWSIFQSQTHTHIINPYVNAISEGRTPDTQPEATSPATSPRSNSTPDRARAPVADMGPIPIGPIISECSPTPSTSGSESGSRKRSCPDDEDEAPEIPSPKRVKVEAAEDAA